MKWELRVEEKRGAGAPSTPLTVDAPNWLEALKQGLKERGEPAESVKRFTCNVADSRNIVATDFALKRVFHITRIEGNLAEAPLPQAEAVSFLESKRASVEKAPEPAPGPAVESFMKDARPDLPPVPPPAPGDVYVLPPEEALPPDEQPLEAPLSEPAPQARRPAHPSELKRIADATTAPAPVVPAEHLAKIASGQWQQPPAKPAPKSETPSRPAGRRDSRPPIHATDEPDENRVIAEVFEELQDLFLTRTQDEAAEFVLAVATKKIPSEAGTVFLADINSRDLTFAAVKGPTAEKLKGRRLHMQKGIVGFAAREGAAIAIADVAKDPRFCNDFDQSGGFITKSVLCAPVQYEGRTFGAVELLNRAGGGTFNRTEMNIITYLASQLAEYIATSLPSGEPDFTDDERPAPSRPSLRGVRSPVATKIKARTQKRK